MCVCGGGWVGGGGVEPVGFPGGGEGGGGEGECRGRRCGEGLIKIGKYWQKRLDDSTSDAYY